MKGVILAAGYGTRFLPATKTLPKEMLPLIDKPTIAFIIEEFVRSGIKDVIVVTSRRKKVMDDYFDRESELEELFTREQSRKKLEKILPADINVAFVRQQEMNGSGHALLAAAPWLGNEPCVVAYPDDLHFGEEPLAKQLIDAYHQNGQCQLATMTCATEELERYGVVAFDDAGKVTSIVEKPARGTAPSNQASIGRFLYTSKFFTLLQEEADKFTDKGEFYHTHGLNRMMALGEVGSVSFSGQRLDVGEPAGYLEATFSYAQQHAEFAPILADLIKKFS
ncbi:UTP--glucose-1-phosphate uridylyltransferase [Entomospira culicis]|uniref:UTP--glucose-1-phosphate uridylyltransferase n=1 Tax=Entomospira culicis TaxID=2719989 RepID=A0A968KU31_9SPIO|nr:UTP--glucose-1-phosphate uridylyltransferase [Entomospira culicis]NIZ18879.1 UTP--glucose-1-phosphate uridylyltransferase [Entomospira culicis]NIZ69094.1 UTP--glucose-1-phosphate uridylyltransferase [Entomospira culicis]WDI37681.1 UTP--glucose-1-phosphate uridylyltransferase [Entomospira culicis]WDI39309.1 UTP--glucose-1-phosphate uridylyltransferase [Entomospira culicis]